MRDVLRAPGALSLFVASCVARLPMGALGLLLVLHTQQLTGSYAKGGLAAGAYAIALALSNPALARIVDRRGQTLVLRAGAPLAAAAIVVLAALPDGAPLGAILAAAAVAGACQPPVGACMRALWPVLLDSPDRRHAAYSMEGALLEIVYICGPVLIVAGIGSWSTAAAMVACAAFLLVGDLAFSAHPVSRAWRPHAERARDLTGALRGPGVRVLVAVFVLCGLSIGAVEVVVPAALDATGHRELTGVLLGALGRRLDARRAGDRPRRRRRRPAPAPGPRARRPGASRTPRSASRARRPCSGCCCSSPARRSRRRSSRPTGCSTTSRPRARSPRPSRGPRPGSPSASPRAARSPARSSRPPPRPWRWRRSAPAACSPRWSSAPPPTGPLRAAAPAPA